MQKICVISYNYHNSKKPSRCQNCHRKIYLSTLVQALLKNPVVYQQPICFDGDMKLKTDPLRIAALLTILLALLITAYVVDDFNKFESLDEAKKLEHLWQQDLENLRQAGKLPKAFRQIQSIRLIPGSEQAQDWLKKIQVPIPVQKDGNYLLEILVLSWNEGEVLGAIIQYNLVELPSQNMLWELGRTFLLRGDQETLDKLLEQEEKVEATSPNQVDH